MEKKEIHQFNAIYLKKLDDDASCSSEGNQIPKISIVKTKQSNETLSENDLKLKKDCAN